MKTAETSVENAEQLWNKVRSAGFRSTAEEVIRLSHPIDILPIDVSHVRTAHYAAYRVTDSNSDSWLVRIGARVASDEASVSNSGYLGTSVSTPTGQHREVALSQAFESSGADVIAVRHYAQVGQLDVTWSPFICGANTAITARQWNHALTGLYAYRPSVEIPVFTNRAKTMQRISELRDVELAGHLQAHYDFQLKELFTVCSRWSVVHGDAHGGNALVVDERALLFDFDTTCWAPSVWDLTHLLNRAGNTENSGYTAGELTSLFNLSSTEIEAALRLRSTASLIAKKHREQFSSLKI